MSRVNEFHFITEQEKPISQRIFHNNLRCPVVRELSFVEQREGTGGYKLCPECGFLNKGRI
jgi:hypothetical protein